jgi:hypothetical protein
MGLVTDACRPRLRLLGNVVLLRLEVEVLKGGLFACAEGMDMQQAASSPQFSMAELTKAGNALATATPWTEERAECLHASGMPLCSFCLGTLAMAESQGVRIPS